MQSNISKACADFLRSSCVNQENNKLKATHARELAAAFFGYKSHAALLAEKTYPLDNLADAAVLVPDVVLIDQRRKKLEGLPDGLPESRALAQQLADFLKDEKYFSGKVWLYDSLETYVMEVLLPENDSTVMDALGGQMAETNAQFDETYYEEASVLEGDDGITVAVTGQCNGTSDQDKPFCGDQLDINVTVELSRVAARNAFMEPDISANGGVNDDWVDPELKYGKIPEGSPKEQFIAMTGGFRWDETRPQFKERQKKILAIREKITSGKAGVNDVNTLSELLGTDRDEFDMSSD